MIRQEAGKTAEVFTLVLRNTVEESWFRKSTEGKDFIEIDESELFQILNNETLDKTVKTQSKSTDFRY